MTTLFEATYRTARALGIVTEGVATGGTVNNVIDTNDRAEADDYWNGGSVWILRDSLEGSAAPEGEFGIVSDFLSASDEIVCRNVSAATGNAFTVAVALGDRYAVGKRRYPLHQIIQKVNEVLADLGPIVVTDATTLTIAPAQTEYTLPAAARARERLKQVWIQGRTNDPNDNRWEKIYGWDVQGSTTVSGDTLILPFQYPDGRKLKLVYTGSHLQLDDASDAIDRTFELDWLVAEAALRLLLWRQQKVGAGDPTLPQQIGYYVTPGSDGQSLIDRLRGKRRLELPQRTPRLVILGPRSERDEFRIPDGS